MNKIYLFSQYFHPESISTGQLLTELVERLSLKGWKSHVTAAQPTYYGRERVERTISLHERATTVSRINNLQLDKNSLIGKALNYFSVSFLFSWRQLFVPTKRLIVAVTNPAIFPILAAIVATIRNQKLIIIVHDVYPEIVAALGYLRPDSLLYSLWKRVDAWAHSKADAVVVLGRDMEDQLRTRLGYAKYVSIPNWSDVPPVHRSDNLLLKKQQQLKNKFVVLYSGNLGLFHPIECILNAARIMSNLGCNQIHFLFIGGGGKLPIAKEMAGDYRLTNVSFLPYQPKELLPHSLGLADVGIVSLSEGVSGLAVPSKLYGLLSAGKPIVANVPPDSEVALVIDEETCGIHCGPNDSEALAAAVIRYFEHPDLLSLHGNNARVAAKAKYSLDVVTDKYDKLFGSVLAS